MCRREDIRNKVYERVEIIDLGYETPCHIWTGPDSGSGRGGGYPRMSLDGQTVAVHIVMYVNTHGYVPGKKQIDHKCRNRMCVNEAHLEMVTHKQNQRRRRDAQLCNTRDDHPSDNSGVFVRGPDNAGSSLRCDSQDGTNHLAKPDENLVRHSGDP